VAGLEQISAVLFQISLFRARSEVSVTSCLASRKQSRPMARPLPFSPLCTGSEYAELVALRIAQHLPAPSGVDVVWLGWRRVRGPARPP